MKRILGNSLALVLTIGIAGLSACGGGVGSTPHATNSSKYAYVANNGSSSVSQYTIGASGALTAMTPAMVTAGMIPYAVTVDPTSKYAYVTDFAAGGISQYTIGATGALTPMTTTAGVSAGTSPVSIATTP